NDHVVGGGVGTGGWADGQQVGGGAGDRASVRQRETILAPLVTEWPRTGGGYSEGRGLGSRPLDARRLGSDHRRPGRSRSDRDEDRGRIVSRIELRLVGGQGCSVGERSFALGNHSKGN